jgi:hypothetical protein
MTDLYDGFKHGNIPEIEVNLGFYLILGGGTVAKLYLWQLCRKAEPRSDSLDALAEDHLNDVASNVAAIFTAGTLSYLRETHILLSHTHGALVAYSSVMTLQYQK